MRLALNVQFRLFDIKSFTLAVDLILRHEAALDVDFMTLLIPGGKSMCHSNHPVRDDIKKYMNDESS